MNAENDQTCLGALLKAPGGAQGQRRNIAAMEEITPADLTFNNLRGMHIVP
jgi:hypothetical protein